MCKSGRVRPTQKRVVVLDISSYLLSFVVDLIVFQRNFFLPRDAMR